MESEITGNFSFQLTTASRSLLMGRPIVITRDHPCGALPRLIEDAPLGQVHPDADLLDSSVGPTDERPVRRTVQ